MCANGIIADKLSIVEPNEDAWVAIGSQGKVNGAIILNRAGLGNGFPSGGRRSSGRCRCGRNCSRTRPRLAVDPFICTCPSNSIPEPNQSKHCCPSGQGAP